MRRGGLAQNGALVLTVALAALLLFAPLRLSQAIAQCRAGHGPGSNRMCQRG